MLNARTEDDTVAFILGRDISDMIDCSLYCRSTFACSQSTLEQVPTYVWMICVEIEVSPVVTEGILKHDVE